MHFFSKITTKTTLNTCIFPFWSGLHYLYLEKSLTNERQTSDSSFNCTDSQLGKVLLAKNSKQEYCCTEELFQVRSCNADPRIKENCCYYCSFVSSETINQPRSAVRCCVPTWLPLACLCVWTKTESGWGRVNTTIPHYKCNIHKNVCTQHKNGVCTPLWAEGEGMRWSRRFSFVGVGDLWRALREKVAPDL